MLTERDHFKIGVLKACAEQGLDMEQTHLAVKWALLNLQQPELVKEAFWGELTNKAVGGAGKVVGKGVGLATWALKNSPWLLAAPAAAGGGVGYMLGRGGGKVNDEDIDEAKQRELISTYNRVADEAERKRAVGQQKRQRRSTPVRSLV